MTDPRILQTLARIDAHYQAGDFQQVEQLCRQNLAIEPRDFQSRLYLGAAYMAMDRFDQAVAAFEQATRLQPNDAAALVNLAAALHKARRFDEAIVACRHALKIQPNHAGAHNNLGLSLHEAGKFHESVPHFERAISLQPANAGTIANLATTLSVLGRFDESIELSRRAIALNPKAAGAYNTLGNALKETGQLTEALTAYRDAAPIAGDWLVPCDNYLYSIYFHPDYTARDIYEEHGRWNRQYAQPLAKLIAAHSNDRNRDRRLRIGYVAPDFREHSQSFFTIPLLSNHDHARFEIFCYADLSKPDALTDRIRGYADKWREIFGLSDARVAEMILADQIDILVDLTMHMGSGRPLLFARKPAPVQVAWLGYPGTSGMKAMDYRLTDPFLDPPGLNDEFYSEQSIRLPHTFWCYDPLTTEPTVNQPPVDKNAFITFGCLNNFGKINDVVLDMWAGVLQSMPDSRLLLIAPMGSARQRVLERLMIDPSRVEFLDRQPRAKYLSTYHRIDIALDTFPANGHTTSFDAWWMGVPVVSYYGNTAISRAGLSQSSNLGLPELATDSRENFVKIALALANDRPRLRELRSTLRRRMQSSPLMDAVKFTLDMESIYRTIWTRWCDGGDQTKTT